MKSTWFGSRSRYEFARLIESGGGYGQMIYNSFDQWLEMAWIAMRQAVNKFSTGSIDDALESRIIDLQNQSKDWHSYAAALSLLAVGMEEDGTDFLGQVFQELSLADKSWKGQCFTPMSVCRMMAAMAVGNQKPINGQTLWISEPAVGGGAMVLATSKQLKENGFCPWHYHWHCIDVDWRCAAMTYIQTTLAGIPAVVIHGNALTLENHLECRNMISVMHPPKSRTVAPVEDKIRDCSKVMQSETVEAEATTREPLVPNAAGEIQLELF